MGRPSEAAAHVAPHSLAGRRTGSAVEIRRLLASSGPLITLVAMIAFFAAASPQFLTVDNAKAILESAAIPAVLAVGMTFVILQGSIDLSVEGVMAASSMAVSLLIANSMTTHDWGAFALVAAIAFGGLFGLANGILYTWLRLPSLIVTLATWFIGLGVATLLFPGRQPQILDPMLPSLAIDKVLGLSTLVYVAGAVVAFGYLIQTHTQFGRLSMAIGMDEKTTRHSGLPVDFHKCAAFAGMGLIAGAGGVMISAQLSVGNPSAGQGFLFPTISAAVIGGTLLSGGRGGVLHSVVGVAILEVLRNGMVQLGVDPYLRHVVEGVTIITALAAANWGLRTRLRVVK